MFKRIMVAVDGSHTSELALHEAIKLAKELDSKLLVLHVVDSILLNWPEGGDLLVVAETLREAGKQLLRKTEAILAEEGVAVETKLQEIEIPGPRIAEVIVAEAEKWPADLIIIGSHGRRGVSRLLLGSVAENVTRISHAPVMIIRGK